MLTKPMAVMVNRGADSLHTSRFTATNMGLPLLGEDPDDMVLTDSGNAMVGFGFRQAKGNFDQLQCCSLRFLDPVSPVINPGSELEFARGNISGFVNQAATLQNVAVADVEKNLVQEDDRTTLSFFDVDGNLSTFTEHTVGSLTGDDGAKIRSLLTVRGFDLSAGPEAAPATPTLIRITLQVSNLAASEKFYTKTLGLTALSRSRAGTSFDAGPILLTIKPETHPGLVRSLKRQEALKDQLIFHVKDIRAEVKNLTRLGVFFPQGIETSVSAGAVAYFADPDGHNLWLWQPPTKFGKGMKIDFFPTLKRILKEHA
jgi:catechol 2,3-dioxygenase-like lactoylglutathione lyase family enzyme